MIQRATDDRRSKKIKVEKDTREIKRRQEDIDNTKAYYGVLGLSLFIFIIIGLISFLGGK